MSDDSAGSALAEWLRDWQPGSVELTRRVDPWSSAAFAGLIDAPSPLLSPVDGAAVGVEEQDIIYRSEPEGAAPRAVPRPGASVPEWGVPKSGEWRLELAPDPVLVFRFGALTYKGHRIHYDWPYATQVEATRISSCTVCCSCYSRSNFDGPAPQNVWCVLSSTGGCDRLSCRLGS